MFRYLGVLAVLSLSLTVGACRCNQENSDSSTDEVSTQDNTQEVERMESGERVVKRASTAEPSPPPLLPGEKRRPRGEPEHPEPTEPDPTRGEFTLEQATEGLPEKGRLIATIEANLGRLRCELFEDRAPNTVANFVGLARGKRPWWDPHSGEWVSRHYYDGLNFYKVIPGQRIEGGCALSDGTGGPGYTLDPEIVEGLGHDEAGILTMVTTDDGVNGGRFMILDGEAPHLNGRNPVFGRCQPANAVFRIARVPQGAGHRPLTDVMIRHISISREE